MASALVDWKMAMAMLEAEEKKLRERLKVIDELKDGSVREQEANINNGVSGTHFEQGNALGPSIESSNTSGSIEEYERIRDESHEEQEVKIDSDNDEFEDVRSVIRSSIIASTQNAAASNLQSFAESRQSVTESFHSFYDTEPDVYTDFEEDDRTPRNSIIDSHLEQRRRSLLEERTNHLPDEIVLEITAYVARGACSQQALATCCLLSRKW